MLLLLTPQVATDKRTIRVFGERVYAARLKIPLSQQALADLLEMKKGRLAQIEQKGAGNMYLDNARKLAEKLGVPMAFLTTRAPELEDEHTRPPRPLGGAGRKAKARAG